MFKKMVIWILNNISKQKIEIGRKGIPVYLTRWILFGKREGALGSRRVFVHWFQRGDVEPYPHDHPWSFWSLILWGGYYEIVPDGHGGETRKWYGPGRLLRRRANWQHRVEIPDGRRCWTLLWIGPKERSWGFICPGRGWIPWREHAANQANDLPGCGE